MLIRAIFPRICARTHCAHPRARVLSFSHAMMRTVLGPQNDKMLRAKKKNFEGHCLGPRGGPLVIYGFLNQRQAAEAGVQDLCFYFSKPFYRLQPPIPDPPTLLFGFSCYSRFKIKNSSPGKNF